MPYIKKHLRWNLDTGEALPTNPGELNYLITMVLRKYEEYTGTNYQSYNDMLGALEGAKLELYRRRVAPYEDVKITENGDV